MFTISAIRELLTAVGANPMRATEAPVVLGVHRLLSSETEISTSSIATSIVQCMACMQTPERCNSLRGITEEDIISVVTYYMMSDLPITFDCNHFRLLLQYRLAQGNWPENLEVFVSFVRNMIRAMNDPEAFHRENKVNVGVRELNRIKNLYDVPLEGEVCAICQDDFSTETKQVLRFKCGHAFHTPEDEEGSCLGKGSGILNWISSDNKCPVCRQEITMTWVSNFHRRKRLQDIRRTQRAITRSQTTKKRKT
jgi:hypothetical protein